MNQEKNYLIQFDLIKVKCCGCYENYWNGIRKSNETMYNFDYSIEKNKSFRKFFQQEMILFHFCESCLKKAIFNIQFVIVSFREYFFQQFNKFLVADDTCIADFLNGKTNVKNICNDCIQFAARRFKNDDFKLI